MRVATVAKEDGVPIPVLVTDDDEALALGGLGYGSVVEFIAAGASAYAEAIATDLPVVGPLASLTVGAPVPRPPRNAFAVGTNYRQHFDEGVRPAGSGMPDKPIIFTKPFTSIVGTGSKVVIGASLADQVDWEAEIAVVIGTGGADITRAEALDHVFGYCLANDLSARKLQLANAPMSQWFKGKSLDGFCPLGPWLVPRADIEDEGAIDVALSVNGVKKQEFVSGAMYFDVPAIIEYLSLGMALLPGDVILTGTSSGVGYWRDPKEFLVPGDEVVIRSSVLGVLTTSMVGAPG